MDVYKWATKLGPVVPGDLLLDCFELARDIRTLDMRASPYDVTTYGLEPVAIETPEGKADTPRPSGASPSAATCCGNACSPRAPSSLRPAPDARGAGVVQFTTRSADEHGMPARRPVAVALIGLVALLAGGATADVWVDHRGPTLPDDLPVETLTATVDLPYAVQVLASRGCPQYSFRAPVPDPGAAAGTSNRTFRLASSPVQAVFVTCLPDAGGSAEAVVAKHIDTPVVDGATIVGGPVLVRSAFGTAYRIETSIGATTLREWYTDHDGVVVAVGFLYDAGADATTTSATVESMIASWSWEVAPVAG